MIIGMTDLWIPTSRKGKLIRADHVVGVEIKDGSLKITTAGRTGGGSSDRWDLAGEELKVCSLEELSERYAKRADRRLVELIAYAREQGIRGTIEVNEGKLVVVWFRSLARSANADAND